MPEIQFPSKTKMCKNKASFRSRERAEQVANNFGQRVYECPICFCFHCTSKENWQDEFLFADDAKTILQMLMDDHERREAKLRNRITQLENEIKNLKQKASK